jgi:putative ABC transport system permease protein
VSTATVPMRLADTLRFARDAATGYPMRTALSVLAMSIGVAAVVILTALGDGARRYVVGQFSSIGTNLVIVLPGRSGTGGFNPANAITTTPRDLTIDDAAALRRAPAVSRVAPLTVGTSEISFGGRLREIMVAGSTSDFIPIRNFELAKGRGLPDEDWNRGSSVAIIGNKIREEVFGNEPAVGQLIRVGDRRLRVIGVLKPVGQGLGMNTDELVIVPAALAQAMFNTNTLFRILVEARSREAIPEAKVQVMEILKQRHRGEEDVTVITQDAILATFDKLLGTLTLGVAGIAAISLAVAGILVMNVMLVAVTQRTGEIGLLKALGAPARTIRLAFLTEAAMLSTVGAVVGYLLGQLGAFALRQFFPVFPAYPPDWAVIAGLSTALGTGLLFGVMPARRAAQLDPVQALMKH